MKQTYKLLALDMDGTLLNSQTEVSAENAQWIRKALDAGFHVCVATGRGYQTAIPFVEQLGLQGPMVLVNGGEVWEHPGKLHHRTPLDVDQVVRLRELALKYDAWYWGYSLEGVYNRDRWAEDALAQTWLKFGYYTEDDQAREHILQELAGIGEFEVTNSHPHNIELNPKGVTKASGLREVCRMLGIDMSECIACGDSLNDLSMIREAGLGVAMGNAQDAVKQAADVVTETNDQDGVARVIQEYML